MLIRDVAAAVSAQFLGDGSLPVERLVHPADAERPTDLAIAISSEAKAALVSSKARAAIIKADASAQLGPLAALVLATQERAALAVLTALFDRGPGHVPGIHASAVVT